MDTVIRIMKKTFLGTLMLTLCTLCGCTQNDGHIGPIFGSWSLVSIMDEGVSVDLEDETVFSFQGEIVKIMRLVNPPYTSMTRYGNFSLSDDVLTLKFRDGLTPSGSYVYLAPDWLYFPKDASLLSFKIQKLTGREMELVINSDGRILCYSFRKTW